MDGCSIDLAYSVIGSQSSELISNEVRVHAPLCIVRGLREKEN